MRRHFSFRPLLVALAGALLIGVPPLAHAQAANKSASKPALTSRQLLYSMFLGEVAAARGKLAEAATLYIDLARASGDARLARRATEIAMASRQGPIAMDAAKQWANLEPESAQALQAYATMLSAQATKVGELESAFKTLLDRKDTAREALLLQLPQYFARFPNHGEVRDAIFRLTAAFLTKPEAHYTRAIAAYSAKDAPQAENSAKEALRLRPNWEAASLLRARLASPENLAAAMQDVAEFARKNPLAFESRIAYARWLISQNRIDEAKTAYTAMLNEYPDNDELAFSIVAVAGQAKDWETAERLLRRLADNDGRNLALLRLQLGQVLEQKGQPAEATEAYLSIPPGPHFSAARIQLAQILASQEKIAAARSTLREAIDKMPGERTTLLRVESELLRRADNPAEAFAVLEEILDKQPENPEVLYESALLADRLKKTEIMEARLRLLIKLQPNNAQAYNALGYSFADRNLNLNEARTLLNTAISMAPNDAAILDSVGWLHFREGDLPAAQDYIRRAYAILQDVEIAAHLCEVLWVSNHRDEARKLMTDSLEANPTNPVLIELKKRLGL